MIFSAVATPNGVGSTLVGLNPISLRMPDMVEASETMSVYIRYAPVTFVGQGKMLPGPHTVVTATQKRLPGVGLVCIPLGPLHKMSAAAGAGKAVLGLALLQKRLEKPAVEHPSWMLLQPGVLHRLRSRRLDSPE